jgi:hypothetical protein
MPHAIHNLADTKTAVSHSQAPLVAAQLAPACATLLSAVALDGLNACPTQMCAAAPSLTITTHNLQNPHNTRNGFLDIISPKPGTVISTHDMHATSPQALDTCLCTPSTRTKMHGPLHMWRSMQHAAALQR